MPFNRMDKETVTYIYTYTMEHYSTLKENKIMAFTGKWMMELENIMQSKVSQSQKTKDQMF